MTIIPKNYRQEEIRSSSGASCQAPHSQPSLRSSAAANRYGARSRSPHSCCSEDLVTSGCGVDPPLMAQFPPGELSMGWAQVDAVGAGLRNMGNTCYINAALQCLAYTPPLTNYLRTGQHSRACCIHEFCMVCVMEKLVHQVFCTTEPVICPLDVINALSHLGNQFSLGHQGDSHEFLQSTMAAMQHSCLPSFQRTRQTEAPSFIDRVFGGFLRSRVTCSNCRAYSDMFDPFLDIPLEIESVGSIYKALLNFVNPDLLGGQNSYKCRNCQQMVLAQKRFSIHRSSNVLLLTLKRFSMLQGKKMMQHLRYPEELDLRPFMSDLKEGHQDYCLYAVLVHSGANIHSGHYFCYVKVSHGLWYKMNDSVVSVSDINEVLRQQAYVLFYLRFGATSPASAESAVTPQVNATDTHIRTAHVTKISGSDPDQPGRDQPDQNRQIWECRKREW